MINRIKGELSQCMLGNINANFLKVAFDYSESDELSVRFILSEINDLEKELAEDTIFEFEALHGRISGLSYEVILSNETYQQLPHLLFQAVGFQSYFNDPDSSSRMP